MEEKMKISEAELEVLQVLWDAEEPLKYRMSATVWKIRNGSTTP